MLGFGSFHIEIKKKKFFTSLEKIIEGSGGPHILTESSVAAMGPMNEFLRGKVYNRCRRGYVLLSAATDGLHLKQFFEHNDIHESFVNELESWKKVIQKVIVSNTYLKNMLLIWRRQWRNPMEKQLNSGLIMPS